MRKITKQASDFFWEASEGRAVYKGGYKNGGKNFGGNTVVHTLVQPHMSSTSMYLYGNEIVRITKNNLTIGNFDNVDEFYSQTTKERLNGIISELGYKINQVNGEWFVMNTAGEKYYFDDIDYFDLPSGDIVLLKR